MISLIENGLRQSLSRLRVRLGTAKLAKGADKHRRSSDRLDLNSTAVSEAGKRGDMPGSKSFTICGVTSAKPSTNLPRC